MKDADFRCTTFQNRFAPKPFFHFLSGSVSKSDGENARRINLVLSHQIQYPLFYDGGFPAAGTGDDECKSI